MFKQRRLNKRVVSHSRQTVKQTGVVVLLLAAFCQINVRTEVLDDPTAPPGHGVAAQKTTGIKSAPQWVLTLTLIATDRRLANINGTMVGVGTHVAGAQVTAIEPDYVRLRKGDKDLVLELLPKQMKQVVKGTQPYCRSNPY